MRVAIGDPFGYRFVIRSHEVCMEGFDFPFGKDGQLVTLFSASNYGGRSKNRGAYALLSAREADAVKTSDARPLAKGKQLSHSDAPAGRSFAKLGSSTSRATNKGSKDQKGVVVGDFGTLSFVDYEASALSQLKVARERHTRALTLR